MKSEDRIFLIGFSGSGKSTVGSALAKRLKVRFFDTDRMIAKKARMSISDMFARHGEKYFRRLESKTIADVISHGPARMVVALGGGAYQNARNRKLVSGDATVVYLSCSQRELYRRIRLIDDRPLLRYSGGARARSAGALKERIMKLMERRSRYYKSADIVISTTGKTVNEAAKEIMRKVTGIHESHKR